MENLEEENLEPRQIDEAEMMTEEEFLESWGDTGPVSEVADETRADLEEAMSFDEMLDSVYIPESTPEQRARAIERLIELSEEER
jgi:hypothetical protein